MDCRSRHIERCLQVCLVAAVAVVSCAWEAMAAQADSRVRVVVASIDDLRVSDAEQGIALVLKGGAGSNDLLGDPDGSARLDYVHNAPVAKKITAQVYPEHIPAGRQDITLRVMVAGGVEQTIVHAGSSQGPKDVLGNIGQGELRNMQVTYSASATAQGTDQGDYGFMVTFTSLDDE